MKAEAGAAITRPLNKPRALREEVEEAAVVDELQPVALVNQEPRPDRNSNKLARRETDLRR
jgi:hypothetical protein